MTTAPITYELDVPLVAPRRGARPAPPLSGNGRLHPKARARMTRTVRQAVREQAETLGIPPACFVTVTLHYVPGDRRRRDTDNLVATLKPAADGLVDAGVIPDDTPTWCHKHMPVIHPGPGPRRLWLVADVWPDQPGQQATTDRDAVLTRHAELLAHLADPVARAVLTAHAPRYEGLVAVCHGCPPHPGSGGELVHPPAPCPTWQLVDRTARIGLTRPAA